MTTGPVSLGEEEKTASDINKSQSQQDEGIYLRLAQWRRKHVAGYERRQTFWRFTLESSKESIGRKKRTRDGGGEEEEDG